MSPSPPDEGRTADRSPAELILGYLNFSAGRPDPIVQGSLNAFWVEQKPRDRDHVHAALLQELERLREKPAFADIAQANSVLRLVHGAVLPGYLRHHADLLGHLRPKDLLNPFFLARLFEATLSAGAPWEDTERIVAEALKRLNDYVGHRPIAVLEDGRKMEVYPHERFRPLPVYLRGAGVAAGPYGELVAAALEHLAQTPADLLEQASFHPDRLDEIAVDVRAYDALHPVFKRTNYLFGEWDPHLIDNQGYFRRFILRQVILEALAGWMRSARELSPAERLHDASAVLCGTILMASAISGWGPAAHDSTSSLTSLLPVVARQRDAFYARLMSRVSRREAARLANVAEATRQPFGHVRQQLNIALANLAAAQMQRRAVAEQFARLGYAEAARQEAARIPAASIRFECELETRCESAMRLAGRSTAAAAEKLAEATDLLVRGIECGALIDPWNILGFQGQFPLFIAREDAVPDPRAEWLIEYMDRLFAAGGHVLTEAAAGGDVSSATRVREWLSRTAEWWDRFATPTVSDLPAVRGGESAAGALAVAATIAEWRAAGRAAGDLTFWRERVARLESPKAFADVVEVLLNRGDFVASSGLMIQWLSESETIGLGEGSKSFFDLSIRWLRELTSGSVAPEPGEQARLCRRFIDSLEANAGAYWRVPDYSDAGLEAGSEGESRDEESELFGAAYEGVVYRDSTADGVEGSTIDSPASPDGGEFEAKLQELEPRLKFLDMTARLWRLAAGRIGFEDETFRETAHHWRTQATSLAASLAQLAERIEREPIGIGSGDLDANVEYDAQLQSKNQLLHLVTGAAVRMASADRLLGARVEPVEGEENSETKALRALLAGDVIGVRRSIPGLLKRLAERPLLYVAVENGGQARKVIDARLNQDLLTILATELPRVGLLREGRQVLRTALRMERRSRPSGLSITEFDRLFRTGFEAALRTAIHSRGPTASTARRGKRLFQRAARRRPFGAAPDRTRHRRERGPARGALQGERDDAVVALVGAVVERHLNLWLRHAATMRLTAVEALNDSAVWSEARRFIRRYGGELFHARVLPLSNLRAILHEGVGKFLDHLVEQNDPLHPSALADSLRSDPAFRGQAAKLLELIYAAVVDEIERFVEYNSTTTQSDYGERFDSFLDFLRAEAAYRRDEWDLTPLRIAHEVLAASGQGEAALLWERVVRTRTSAAADRHIARLRALERRHAMRLPTISDRLAERFVKPFAVDRMVALIPLAARDARSGRDDSPSFRVLRREIDEYISTSTGSAADLPDWIGKVELAVSRALDGAGVLDERETLSGRPIPRLRRGQVLRQVTRGRASRRASG